jgi:hypothetical protein
MEADLKSQIQKKIALKDQAKFRIDLIRNL